MPQSTVMAIVAPRRLALTFAFTLGLLASLQSAGCVESSSPPASESTTGDGGGPGLLASSFPIRWRASKVHFQLSNKFESQVPGITKAFRESFAAWSGVGGAPQLVLDIVDTPIPDFDNAKDCINRIVMTAPQQEKEAARVVIQRDSLSNTILTVTIAIVDPKTWGVALAEVDINKLVADQIFQSLGGVDEGIFEGDGGLSPSPDELLQLSRLYKGAGLEGETGVTACTLIH